MLRIVLIFTLSYGMSAFAQVPKKKVTQVRFDNQLVDGQGQKPNAMLVTAQKEQLFKKMIRLRKDFSQEMEETAMRIENK